MADDALSIWVVYDHPRDHPDYWVARRHLAYGPNAGPTEDMIYAESLEMIREEMERMFLTRLERFPGDEDVIVETWL